ncbi:hypothetical protein RCL1_003721 [Eukaryota sp. TZLM3-RCL]
MASSTPQLAIVAPVKAVYALFESKTRCQIMLYENKELRLEGVILGFDEFMNLVLDNANEINTKKQTKRSLGRLLLKGDNIAAIFPASQ